MAKKIKYRGKIQITHEMLHATLGLTDSVQIIKVLPDEEREIVSFVLVSDEEVPSLTYRTGEGMTILSSETSMESLIKKAIKTTEAIKRNIADGNDFTGNDKRIYEEALAEFQQEELQRKLNEALAQNNAEESRPNATFC